MKPKTIKLNNSEKNIKDHSLIDGNELDFYFFKKKTVS